MTTSITQANIDNLESALASGELQVRIGDRWITYRSVQELKEALAYAKEALASAANTTGAARPSAYVTNLDRGLG